MPDTPRELLPEQINNRLARLRIPDLKTFPGSVAADPGDPAILYAAADLSGRGVLLRLGADGPARFRGVERLADGVAAIPFASTDHDNIRKFAEEIAREFLPRSQGARAAIAAGNRHPEISLPAVFEAYRTILNSSGLNLASTSQLSATREMTTEAALAARGGENPTAPGHTRVSIRHLYHAGLWAAIRAGWREGYTAEADHFIVSGNTPEEIARSTEATKEAIRHAAGYTKFTTDTSRLFELRADARHPAPWSEGEIEQRFEALFGESERRWILAEFAQPVAAQRLAPGEIRRLAVKFGPSLKLNEELYDFIREVKAGKAFDFEPSLDEAETLTTPQELSFYLRWLAARGRPAQLVPPNLGFKKRQAYPPAMPELEAYAHHKMWPELLLRVEREFGGRPLDELAARVSELAEVAREFDGTLSIHSGSGKQPEVLETIGRATARRVNYKISGELQLQLFDVLSEQPAGSRWRALYDRMVARCNAFAARGAFGEESELARKYPSSGLGDAGRGRVDGNLFLVFWLGNVVGSRDADGRFFKEALDELPPELLAEVRRRNAAYIVWLARHLVQ